MWVLLGAFGFFLQWWFSLFDSPTQWPRWLTDAILQVWGHIALGLWSAVVTLAVVQWLPRSLGAWSTKHRWLKQDGREDATHWPGGTAECLRLGHLYRGGSNLDTDQWQHYWHPQQTPANET